MEKEALYALPVYGDILAVSILQLARKNPGIAVADVERNLCGLKTKKKIKNLKNLLTFGSECDKVNELLMSNESHKSSLKSFEKT